MTSDNGLTRIQRTSRRFRLFFEVLIILVPLANLAFWIGFNWLPAGFLQHLPVAPTGPLPMPVLAAGFLVSLLPLAVVVFGLLSLRTLFVLYENGIIFAGENVRCFRRLGYAFIAWVFATILHTPLLSIVLTATNPPGEKALVLQVGSPHLTTLITGGIVLLIAWVMDEGRKLEDEQAHTV